MRNRNGRPNDTLIFVHIPKTGGLTIRSVLYRLFPDAGMTVIRYKTYGTSLRALERFKAIDERERAKIKVLTGHIHFGYHHYLPQGAAYFTMLRHPVDQVVSFYYHRLKTLPHLLINPDTDEPYSLEEYVTGNLAPEKLHYLVIDNLMTRRLCTIDGTPHFVGFGHCTKTMLELAKDNLKSKFKVVGLTERFNESLLLLFQKMRWPAPYYAKVNVNKRRPQTHQISPELIAKIEAVNSLDMELYRYAQTLFEEAIEHEGLAFQKRLKRFEWVNRYVAMPAIWAKGLLSVPFGGARVREADSSNLPDFNSV